MIAVLWMAFSVVILIFPTTPGPTGPTMNYTIVVMGGWLLLCVAYYYLPVYGGVYWFKGPIANIEKAESDAGSISVEDVPEKEKYAQD